MNIVMAASEAAPFIKSGGLGDVMQALPAELARIPGNQVSLFLPYYASVKHASGIETELAAEFQVGLSWRQQYAGIYRLKSRKKKLRIYFIDNEYYFGREGGIYGFGDDGERFAYFSKAVLDAMAVLGLQPDVLQCNDWQTAAIPVFLKTLYRDMFPETQCVFTIHNIEYQGWANADFFDSVLGLPELFRSALEKDGAVNLMKGAIELADAVTTVSQSYSQEILHPYFAHGLSGVLSANRNKLSGITNGIDMQVFDPAQDAALPCRYCIRDFPDGKARCKAALQRELGLPVQPGTPLLAIVSRLAEHKGIDLLCYIARRLLCQDVQLVVVGTGEQRYEAALRSLEADFPDQVSVQLCFRTDLASRVYAGADIYLMPSKSEPCGLSQMNAMRYGTVPVVHATGGLRDTVPPVDDNGMSGLGYTFQSYNGDDFFGALDRCLGLYRGDPEAWRQLVRRDMSQDFSWKGPARQYMALFSRMTAARE